MKENSFINKPISDLEIIKELFPVYKLINKYFDKIFKKFNINQIQFEALYLLYVNKNKVVKMSLLGDKLSIARSGMTLLVDKMALEGLITRRPDTEDRRITNVILMKKGSEIMDEIFQSNDVFKVSPLDFIQDEEKEILHKLITNIKEKLNEKIK